MSPTVENMGVAQSISLGINNSVADEPFDPKPDSLQNDRSKLGRMA